MSITFNVLEGEAYLSPQDVIQRGQDSQLLKASPIFKQAVNDMYNNLTLQEDVLIGNVSLDDRQLNSKIKHYAMMRCLLTDLIMTLDGYVMNAENQITQDTTTGYNQE